MARPAQLIRQSSLFTLWHSPRLGFPPPSSVLHPNNPSDSGDRAITIPLHPLIAYDGRIMCPLSSASSVTPSDAAGAPAAFMDSLNQSILEAAFVWSSFWQQTPRLTPLCEGRELESGAVSWRRIQQIFLPVAILVNKSQKSSHEGVTRGRNFPDSICKLNNVYNLTDQASRRGLNFPSPRP